MAIKFHKNLIVDDLHSLPARIYANLTARNDDAPFHSDSANVNKVVRVDDVSVPPNPAQAGYFILVDITPTWLEFTHSEFDEFIELIDTPLTYTGQAGKILYVKSDEKEVAFAVNLFFNDTENFLGVNNSAPDSQLHIKGENIGIPADPFQGGMLKIETTVGNKDAIHINYGRLAFTGIFEDTGPVYNFFQGINAGYNPATPSYTRVNASEAAVFEITEIGGFRFRTAPTGIVDSAYTPSNIFTISNTGQVVFQNSTDSNTGFQILDADGGIPILSVDTINEFVGIGTNTPTQSLHVQNSMRLGGAFHDGNDSAGSLGQVLGSTITGTDWINTISAIAGSTDNAIVRWDGVDGDAIQDSLVIVSDTGTLTMPGDLIVNTDGLFVDTTLDRVGINTAIPRSALNISGAAMVDFRGEALIFQPALSVGVFININDVVAIGLTENEDEFFLGKNSFYDPVLNSYKRSVPAPAALIEFTDAGNILFRTIFTGLGETTFTPNNVVTIENTGRFIAQNSADSTTGFQILDSGGGTPVFNVDTLNGFIGINVNPPLANLHINSTLRVDSDVLISGDSSNVSLALQSITGSLLLNRLTEVQRDNLSAIEGMLIFNTLKKETEFFNGTIWLGIQGFDEFTELTDTPANYVGASGLVVQVNSGETALEFGQDLRTTASPTFDDITITGLIKGTSTAEIDLSDVVSFLYPLSTSVILEQDGITADFFWKTIQTADTKFVDFVAFNSAGINIVTANTKPITFQVNSVEVGKFSSIGHFGLGVSPSADFRFDVSGAAQIRGANGSISLKLGAPNGALLLNTLTSGERTLLSPLEGMFLFNTNLKQTEFYNGTIWVPGGNVTAVSTPVDNQLAIWTGPLTIEGDAGLIFDGSDLIIGSGKGFQVDVTLFFIDAAGDFVGVGTNSPSSLLDVNGEIHVRGTYRDGFNSVGSVGQILSSTGSESQWVTTNDVQISGTPVNNELAIWINANTIKGDANVTYDGSNFIIAVTKGLIVDTDTLFVDAVNDRVGIGIAAPTQSLHVLNSMRLGGAFHDASDLTGTLGQILRSTITGTQWIDNAIGDVVAVPTPSNDQLAIWTGSNTIEGDGNLVYTGVNLVLGGGKGLVVNESALNVNGGNRRVSMGAFANGLTDVNIFQKVGGDTTKGLTLSGEGFAGSLDNTDGFTFTLNNNGTNDKRMMMVQTSDNGGAGTGIRFIVGPEVPNICGFDVTSGGLGLNFCDANVSSRLAIGHSSIFSTLAGILAKLHIKTTAAFPALMVQAAGSQTASILQIANSSAVIISEFDELGKLTVGGPKLSTADDRAMLDVRGSVAFKRTPTAVSVSTVDEFFIGVTAVPATITISSLDIKDGRSIVIKDESGSATGGNPITIDTQGSETIDGAMTVTITSNYGVVRLYSDGTNLFSW